MLRLIARRGWTMASSDARGAVRPRPRHRIPIAVSTVLLFAVGTVLMPATGAFAGTGCCRQIGISSTDSTDERDQGGHVDIGRFTLPQSTIDGAAVYFWVGLNLSDGTFIQAGTASRMSSCQTQQAWFSQAYDMYDNQLTNVSGSCGMSQDPWRTFKVQRDTSCLAGYCGWRAYMNGSALAGSGIAVAATDSGTNRPGAVAETSTTTGNLSSTSDELGPIGFNNLGSIFGTVSYPTLSAAWYKLGSTVPCPPFNSHWNSGYFVSTGKLSGYSCVTAGGKAW